MEIGRMCMKIAGRDAGEICVIVQNDKSGFVIIDGMTRRRKCNVRHLMPLADSISISDGASHEEVSKAFKEKGYDVKDHKSRESKEKPRSARVLRKKESKKEESVKTKVKKVKAPKVKKESKSESKSESKDSKKEVKKKK